MAKIKYKDIRISTYLFTVKIIKNGDEIYFDVMDFHPHPRNKWERIKEFWTEKRLGCNYWFRSIHPNLEDAIVSKCESIISELETENDIQKQWDEIDKD